MLLLNYFIATIFSFLGLIAGFLLVKIAPEEQKPLANHIVAFRYVIIAVILLLYFYFFRELVSMVSVAILAALLMFNLMGENYNRMAINSAALGAIFFLSSYKTEALAVSSSLIFLYFLLTGTKWQNFRSRNSARIIFFNLAFFLSSLLLYLITTSHS